MASLDIFSTSRLAALDSYQILDTPPEPAFDDIVMIAREVCHTPVALVSLVVEERQWFKAALGFEACETPIGQSVCAHAIVQGSTLIIEDLAQDPRTRDNTLVTAAPFIRFYAGALLRSPEGESLGTLCVIDTEPRPQGLTAAQTTALEALARQVMQTMEMRKEMVRGVAIARANLQLGESLRAEGIRTITAQEAGRIGTFEVDLATNVMRPSAEMCRIFGLERALSYPPSAFETLVVPEDRQLASSASTRSSGTASTLAEYRIRRADDDALRWVARRADYIRDGNGNHVGFTGTVHDITDRKLAEVRQAALVTLGDDVRDATTMAVIVDAASRALGTTLGGSRAGYGAIDFASDTFRTTQEWTAPGVTSFAGVHTLSRFAHTLQRLQLGSPLVVANVPAASWLGPDLSTYAAMAVKAQIVAPLLRRGTLVGVFYVHDQEPRTWAEGEVEFVHAVADRAYAAIAKVEAEDQQRLLNQELSHRLKNTLALVQAIASQTLKTAGDKPAVQAFRNRLMALSKAHDVLLQESWSSAPLLSVIEAVLALHIDRARLDLNGPNLLLGPKAVLSLSMLLHELATNAIKHGSLSVETGHVTLAWDIDRTTPEPTVVLRWLEAGGPPATEPDRDRQGMGSRLIRTGLAGTGDVHLRYLPTGLSAEFRAPLSLVTDN